MSQDSISSDSDDAGSVLRGEYVTDDPCLFEVESSPWEIIATPIDASPFQHWKHYLITPSLIIYRESFKSAVRLRGLAPAGMLGLTLPLNLGSRSTYWNAVPRTDGLYAAISGSVDAVFDSGQAHIMLLIELKMLRRTFPPHLISALEDAARNRFVHASPGAVSELTCWLCSVLDETVKYPQAPLHTLAVESFEGELLDRLLRTLQLEGAPKYRPHISHRQRGLERALRFLNQAERLDLTVPKLCKMANVSQRTLEYAFKEEFGLTPLGFLRLRRFHHARYDLMAAFSPQTTIAEIARRNGFFQLGYFARDYRNLFGERPSQTLLSEFPDMLKDNSPLVW